MALIKCPECGREITDTISTCPNCGYVLKKKKSIAPIVIILVLVLTVGGVSSYFYYFKPQSIMNQVSNLIERGKYEEADILLSSVPSSNRKEELLAQICIGEAKKALETGDYSLAETKLGSISPDKIPNELLQEINEQKATILLGQGQYTEADKYYASLEQTDEVIELRKKLFYESRVLQCALRTKDNLIFPDSLEIKEAVCLYGGTSKDESKSTDEVEVRNYDQPEILLHYQAKTRGGSVTDGYQRYSWNIDTSTYNQNPSVNSLTNDESDPYWLDSADADEILEYREQQREIAWINIQLMVTPTEMSLDDEQLERINNACQYIKSSNVDFIDNNEIVPFPTPDIIQVTPEPDD